MSNCFVICFYITISVSSLIFKHIKHDYFIFCIQVSRSECLAGWFCSLLFCGLWLMVPFLLMGFVIFDCELIFFLKLSVEIRWELDLNWVPPKEICFYFTRYQDATYLQLLEMKSPVCVQIIINSCAHLISMNSDPQSTSMWWDISWGDTLLLPPLPRFSSFSYFSSSLIACSSSPSIVTVQSTLPTSSVVWIFSSSYCRCNVSGILAVCGSLIQLVNLLGLIFCSPTAQTIKHPFYLTGISLMKDFNE